MPAAAVIPALRVYMNVVVVKTLIAYINGSIGSYRLHTWKVLSVGLTESPVIRCRGWKHFTGSGVAIRSIRWRGLTLNKLECLKQASQL